MIGRILLVSAVLMGASLLCGDVALAAPDVKTVVSQAASSSPATKVDASKAVPAAPVKTEPVKAAAPPAPAPPVKAPPVTAPPPAVSPPKVDAPKVDPPKVNPPTVTPPRVDAPKAAAVTAPADAPLRTVQDAAKSPPTVKIPDPPAEPRVAQSAGGSGGEVRRTAAAVPTPEAAKPTAPVTSATQAIVETVKDEVKSGAAAVPPKVVEPTAIPAAVSVVNQSAAAIGGSASRAADDATRTLGNNLASASVPSLADTLDQSVQSVVAGATEPVAPIASAGTDAVTVTTGAVSNVATAVTPPAAGVVKTVRTSVIPLVVAGATTPPEPARSNTDATQVPTAVGGGSGTEAEAAHPEYAAPAAPTDVDDPTAAPNAAVDNPATVPAAERPSAEPASRIVVATAEADAPPIASVDADAVIDVVAAAAQPGAGDSAPTTLARLEGAIQPDEPAAAVPVPTSPLLDPDGPSATPEAWPSNLWAKIEPQARGSVSVPAAVPNPFHAVAEAVTAGSATAALTWSGLSDPIRLPRLPIDLPSGIPPPAVPTGVPLSSTTLFDSGQSGPSAAVLSLLSSTLALATWRVPSVDRLRLPAGIAQAVLVPPG